MAFIAHLYTSSVLLICVARDDFLSSTFIGDEYTWLQKANCGHRRSHLPPATRSKDEFGRTLDHAGVDRHDPAIDRMVDHLTPLIDEVAEHVAYSPCVRECCQIRFRQKIIAGNGGLR